MRQEIHVNEYYDLFDVKTVSGSLSSALTNVPSTIRDTQMTNPFRGFSNWADFNGNNPNNTNPIAGQVKSPQAQNSLRVEDNGDIWCYPPNVSVPYWSRIIFRNYDYNVEIPSSSDYFAPAVVVDNISLADASDPLTTTTVGVVTRYQDTNLFLRFDEYPSRSKVIFSKSDKTRNPDIEFRFAYKKGQMEPIKLNLSLSANVAIRDPSTPTDTYNQNLNKSTIQSLVRSCYWCIEWIYEPETR